MLEYKKFDTQKVTRSAQEIAENLTSLHKSANATFQDNFISCYLPLWELLKWRKNEIAKYTPEYVKGLDNGKTSVQLKAELDASILLCTLDSKGKRVDNSGSFSETDIKKTSALFGKSTLSPFKIAEKIAELNSQKKSANINSIVTAYNIYRTELGVPIDKDRQERAENSANKKADKNSNKKADNKNSFEIPTNLTIKDIDKIVQEFTKQLLKANKLTEANYIAFKESSIVNKNYNKSLMKSIDKANAI